MSTKMPWIDLRIDLLKYHRKRRMPASVNDVCISASCCFASLRLNGMVGSSMGKKRLLIDRVLNEGLNDFVVSYLARGLSLVRNAT